jgi:hypothetical protein
MIRNRLKLNFAWVDLTSQLFAQALILLKSVFIVFSMVCLESELYNNELSSAKRV